ncbi:MAG: hypothetical protein AUK56_02240 [Thiomicrospira sp. CG2_30_44_34]|nr:MAG: hypothetical protein AUK56_02240 [Thiomicrospira sp. CG2_30_44_34]
MKIKKVTFNFILLTVLYVGALFWVDAESDVFSHLSVVVEQLPFLVFLALVSWSIRYARWVWMLRKIGCRFPIWRGFAAYLSGFAFTATPGKVGELVRIRYFVPMGVSHDKIISAFIFERLLDLVVVLFFSLLIAQHFNIFWFAASFVGAISFVLMLLVYNPTCLRRFYVALRFFKSKKLLKIAKYLVKGIHGMRVWVTPQAILVSFGLGVIAWGIIALSFVWLLNQWSLDIDLLMALAIYPLAMLVGAASMIPGGLGSTEASIVALLWSIEVPIAQGAVIAVTIRLATLWSAILMGAMALFYLERTIINGRK